MRLKYVFLVALLSVVLIVPVVLRSGFINLSGLSLFSTAAPSGTLSTPNVFVDPPFFVRDYVDLPIGSTFTLSVNISDVTDLFSWQISLNYNSTLLHINRYIEGDFLMRTGSAYKTSSYQLGWVINNTDVGSGIGSAAVADSILGDSVPGITGKGRLVSIEFQVLHYGSSRIYLNLTGTTPTTLLNSLGSPVTFTKVDGYFRNKIPGDVNGDKTVNILDRGLVSAHWTGPPAGPSGYDIESDVGGNPTAPDGVVNILDRGTVSANWGRSVTLP